MDERLHDALGSVRADEALKSRTKEFLAGKIAGRADRRAAPALRRLAPVLACLLVLLAGFGGYELYFTPVAAIRLEINPALELSVNRLGRVVSSQGLNEDGEALAREVGVRFLPYEEALGRLMESSRVEEPLQQGEVLSIEVIGDGGETGEILAGVESCTENRRNVSCCAGSAEEAAQAAEYGLSLAKYQMYEEIQALDPSFTAEEAASLTMRGLRELLASLQDGGGTASGDSTGNGSGGYGTGAGYGPGDGSGNGSGGPGNGAGCGPGDGSGSGSGGNGMGCGPGGGSGSGSGGTGNGTGYGPGNGSGSGSGGAGSSCS